MLRTALILSGFVGISLGLVLLQPSLERDAVDTAAIAEETSPISRADTEILRLASLPAAPHRPAAEANTDLDALTQGVLASLSDPTPTATDDPMRSMTQGVLARLGNSTNANTVATPVAIEGIISQALRQGQSDAYLEALLAEAASNGQIAVPEALRTTDGDVDTRTLLATLVQRSTGGNDASTQAIRAEARPVQRRPAEATSYVVEPGDSLAGIAYRFYGETIAYQRIFEANRDRIASPNMIRVGQTLVIPAG